MRKYFPLPLVAAIIISLALPLVLVRPAHAQSGSTFNFAISAYGWTAVACPASCYGQTNPPYNDVPAGSYTGGAGWQSATASDGYHSGGVWIVNGHIDYTFPSSQSIDQIDVYYTASNLNGGCGGELRITTDNVDGSSGAPANGSHTESYTSFGESGTSHIHIKYDSCETASNSSGSILITQIVINGGGSGEPVDTAWAYPLAAGDRAFLNYLPSPFKAIPGSVDLLFSNDLGAYVHSSIAGTVESVGVLNGDCIDLRVNEEKTTTRSKWPSYSCWDYTDATDVQHHLNSQVYLSAEQAYLVTISTPGIGVLSYIVASPLVHVGEAVSKGCIIGKTLPYYTDIHLDPVTIFTPGSGGNPQPYPTKSTQGYTLVQALDDTATAFDIIPSLAQAPQDIICGQSARSGTCKLVTNPTFSNGAASWSLEPDSNSEIAPSNPPGTSSGLAMLDGQARQSLSLEESREYSILVTWHEDTETLEPSFSIQLGTSDPITLYSNGIIEQSFKSDPATYTPNAPNLFDLIVKSDGGDGKSIIVDSICVFDPDDTTKPPPPGGCLIYNPEFDQVGDWVFSEGSDFGNGTATMSDGGTLEQTTHLYPKPSGPQDYTITVRARRAGVPVSGQSIDLLWHINSDSNTTLGTFSDHNWKDVTDTFEITTDEDVTVHLEASGSDDQVLELDSVCITTTDGDSPPGYGSRDPLSATCKACIYEVTGDLTTDVPELVQWLGCRMNQIWYCQAKIILYGIWQALISILTFLGFLRLWMAGTIMAGAGWMNSNIIQVAGWLNGQFINLTTAITNVFSSGGHVTVTNNEGNTNFWDALVALFNGANGIVSSISTTLDHFITSLRDIILTAIDRTWQLILLIIGIVLLIINIIVTVVLAFLNFILTLINVLFTIIFAGINTPAVIPTGMPTCDTGASTIPESCVPIFMLDHSWFADNSPVNLLVTLIEGSVAFSLFVWAVYRIRGAFTEAS